MAPHHAIQAITSEGLAQGPYVAASGSEPAILRTEDHQSASIMKVIPLQLGIGSFQSIAPFRIFSQIVIEFSHF